jgi:hypothetical protein
MRDNGVPNFPDPLVQPDGCQSEAQALGIDTGGGDAEAQDALLRLSRCMRSDGLPEFPTRSQGAMRSADCTTSSATTTSSRHGWRRR